MQRMLDGWLVVRQTARKIGPYLLLEIVIPGGTPLLALLLYLHDRCGYSTRGPNPS